ncbi:sporulation protein [Nannocystis pusilla]|uniref:Sporulation protein n=1 Tax=Nannocystis pusilla TaxID=889268 RepID=A0ABS7U1T9_9BACT|nr:sporulation protein [Nannocystis pusilla]MBZ5714487.1 sporulation protein [Nannocystis pusilla]
MEFIHRLKGAVGIGAPTLTIAGVAGPVRAGEVIRGTVAVRGGSYEVPVLSVALHFDEQRLRHTRPSAAMRPDRVRRRHLASAELALDGPVLQPGQQIVREFALPLPPALAPSAGSLAYALVAEMAIAGLDPRAEVPLVVVA